MPFKCWWCGKEFPDGNNDLLCPDNPRYNNSEIISEMPGESEQVSLGVCGDCDAEHQAKTWYFSRGSGNQDIGKEKCVSTN